MSVSKTDVRNAGQLSVWIVKLSNYREICGKKCVFIGTKETCLGPVFQFHVPGDLGTTGKDRLRTLPPKNLTKLDDSADFPYTGSLKEKDYWLQKNPLNGVQNKTYLMP
jgi:hypothetical protein